MALTKQKAETVWGSVGDGDNDRLGRIRHEDLYSTLAEALVDSLIESETENIALKKVRYMTKFERRLSLQARGGAKRAEPKFEEKLIALRKELIAELLQPACRNRFFRAAKAVDDISKQDFVETAVAGGSLEGHEKFHWNLFNRVPQDLQPVAPVPHDTASDTTVAAQDDFLRNRSKSQARELRLSDCPNLVTDWPVGERTGPCPDCYHPRNIHPRGAVPGTEE